MFIVFFKNVNIFFDLFILYKYFVQIIFIFLYNSFLNVIYLINY